MAFSEKITLIVDVVTGNARSGLSKIKGDMAGVDGAFNKMKVGAKGAFDTIGVMGPQVAIAAGAALVGFGVKSVKAFQDTALAADKFRDSTGLGIEESSKWIAVANDVGVSADTFRTAFSKMEKAIGTNKAAFGDLIVTAKDGSTDLSATFLNAVEHLQGIQDPIQRATEASKLFGKGFSEVSQIITTDADDLRDALAGVSEEQIIDEAEVQKAREFQAAMDNLKDSVEDVGRALGEFLVPTLSDLAGFASEGIDIVVNLKEGTGGEKSPIFQNLKEFVGSFWEGITTGKPPWEIWAAEISGVTGALGTAKAGVDGLGGSLRAGKVDAGGWGETITGKAHDAAIAISGVQSAYDLLKGSLSDQAAALNVEEAFLRIRDSAANAWDAVSSGAADADSAVLNHAQVVNAGKQAVVEYGETVLGLPAEKLTTIIALIDEGKLDQAQAALDTAANDRTAALNAKAQYTDAAERAFENAARTRVAAMNAQAHTGTAESALNNTARTRTATINAIVAAGGAEGRLSELARDRIATITTRVVGGVGASGTVTRQAGGPVPGTPGQPVPILAHGGEFVLDAGTVDAIKKGKASHGAERGGMGGGGGAGTVIITYPVGTDPRSVRSDLDRWQRRNGSR